MYSGAVSRISIRLRESQQVIVDRYHSRAIVKWSKNTIPDIRNRMKRRKLRWLR